MSFAGGPLKLKGQPVAGVKKKKKQQGKEKELALAAEANAADKQQQGGGGEGPSTSAGEKHQKPDLKRALHGYELPQPDENADRRTAAEKRFQEHQVKLEQERLSKLASKSHRDRVKEFNDYLAHLSEHHDIPRVGPG
uniref:DUF1754-domain-containing protein n=1 Tax=Dunaliella tertiolecta TaxID=3047 RepID=A0A7S3R194_DUNTE|mmetsp:Transcript_8032/g.21396  ORF Transcript_8032/g.21396 Transcript_8032/m.21396 type:complete len:138 (-) Transcript_8032:565-978(-)|eukprot:CAMPEP_0202349502 /NCGR_PEP_ID=MMETSP1126-20121109/6971_1 /ASSEMBLY_ACC=CAM_ASM_000457 /TAXON_ID=3047 /ORGANISM="Dunaliella tertiolecta, Strain CCMP1320" /LENGTH=137 /DNA_ID=CAMNT_0048941331 /DNA_START=196 /DNA_END=609 /DNA_ORIENTATION=+